MSVNSTVARLRSESGVDCTPVRNSWATSIIGTRRRSAVRDLDRQRTENQGGDPLRVGGREHRGDRRPLTPGRDRGPGRPGRVHHRHNVIGSLLQRRHASTALTDPTAQGGNNLAPLAAIAVLGVYALVLLAVATQLVLRRDVA